MGPDRRATELEDDISARLFVLSAGRVETIFGIVEQAALYAIEENSLKVHREHLVRALDEFKTRRGANLAPWGSPKRH